ncbi:diacylglycerol kinase family protein [Microbacterium trichothecenolyticum]|uniref:Diacylglycerol kinase (ATP) n=1 Tax=Microbacterium trichothecenolyticum TaxID=69370 RepID=A0ABU0TXZ1_MICTR|nr:diacylglycerol kinase family protein [Microbacterium trichothecenolyticum]MDQ1124380.1 diacylglycerol kinase (ATP) [Microbacterium trichothecenolyticum]
MAAPDEPRDDAESPETASARDADAPISTDEDNGIDEDSPAEVAADAAAAEGSHDDFHAARLRDDTSDAPGQGKPDPKEAAEPDDVIHQPEDVAPDSSEETPGKTQRVDAEGEEAPMDAEPTQKKRAALVYNPTKVEPETLRARVAELAAEAGWAEPLFYETTVDDLGDDATRAALDEKVDAVLAAGGDGTVRAVAEALTSTDVPLTIVPSGTGNLLARNLNLPLTDTDAMIRATFEGDVHSIDTGLARIRRADGEIEEHGFSVMAGIGLDAAMIQNTRSDLKKQVGWVAYVDGAARSLVSAKPFRVMYQLNGHRLHSAKVHSVLFANCGALQGGVALIPDASVADGRLDVAVLQPSGVLGWLGVWRSIVWDNSVLRRFRAGRRVLERRKDTSVRYLRGTGIELATAPAQPIELDGDEFGEATRIYTRIIPGGLSVALPKGHDISTL